MIDLIAIQELLRHSSEFRKKMSDPMSETSPDAVEQAVLQREEFKVSLQETMNKLADHIDECRAWKRTLENEKSWQTTDVKKLTAKKWELIRSEPRQ